VGCGHGIRAHQRYMELKISKGEKFTDYSEKSPKSDFSRMLVTLRAKYIRI